MTGAGRAARVVLGVGGGIAAYKSCELVRRLRGDGHDVTVVPTAAALNFVGAATFEALSGHRVDVDVFTDVPSVAHVSVGQHADLVVVAPATADLIARMAAGRADDLLTSALLVTRAPVLVAPAMHTEMWTHPATVANVGALRARGVTVLDPAVGRLTGADSGAGRLPDPEHITDLAGLLLRHPGALPYDLAGLRVVVTAGGTREPLDPVRFLGNRSSGRQGYALALAAAARGAQVHLIAANVTLADPPGVLATRVGTALGLQAAVNAAAADADVVVMAAAVADFRPSDTQPAKIKKVDGHGPSALDLTTNPDILAGLVRLRASGDLRGSRLPGGPLLVGFAAETGDSRASALDYARAKLAAKGCDLLVANRVDDGRAFEVANNAAVILDSGAADGGIDVPFGPKIDVAAAVWDAVRSRMGRRAAAGDPGDPTP